MSQFVCKLCIMKNGLKGSDLHKWPRKDDPKLDEWIVEHMWAMHRLRAEPIRSEDDAPEAN